MSRELRGIFRRRGIPADEASDLAQETIVRTLVHLKRHGRVGDDVRPLVHTIARNLLVTRVRRRQLDVVPLTTDEDVADESRQPLDEIIDNERRESVRLALRSLSSRHRQVVTMWMEGLSPAQIARELGIKRNAADALLHRARRRLASKLEPGVSFGLLGAIFLRLRSGVRRITDAVSGADPSGSLVQASSGLAAAGIAALLLVAGPTNEVAEQAKSSKSVVIDVASASVEGADGAAPNVGNSMSASRPVPELAETTYNVSSPDAYIHNPTTGQKDDVGVDLMYDPDHGKYHIVDSALKPATAAACGTLTNICSESP